MSRVQNQRDVEYVFLCILNNQIVAHRWVPCPTNKGASYTNLVYGLVVTLKMDINNIIEMDGKLCDKFISILIYPRSNYNYVNPNLVDKCGLNKELH